MTLIFDVVSSFNNAICQIGQMTNSIEIPPVEIVLVLHKIFLFRCYAETFPNGISDV